MSWIFIIEDQDADFASLREAVIQMEPALETLRFRTSREFLDWMGHLQADVANLDPLPPAGKFLGLITSVTTWRFRDLKLIGKFKTLFMQKGLATSEDELGVVFTGFDSALLQRHRFEHRSVNNIIYKPFEKVLLRQMLEIAFTGRRAVQRYFVHDFATDAKIEMLKEINATGVTETAFSTLADQDVAIGKIAKYYAPFLETDLHRSALARVLRAAPEKNQASGTVTNELTLQFFALDQQQSLNIQGLVREADSRKTLHSDVGDASAFEFIFWKSAKVSLCDEIQPSFERFFTHKMTSFMDQPTMVQHLRAAPQTGARRLVFIDSTLIEGQEVKELEALRKLFPESSYSWILLCRRILPEATELALSALCEDIYYAPFNKSYLVKSLKQRWPALSNKEEIYEFQRKYEQTIHVSNPVRLIETSEAGLIFEYARALPVGSFREFVFWLPNEAQVPPLTAQCNYTAPIQGKPGFQCHFIFFGLHEHELKHIRLWIRHQYIAAKQGAN